ncbi:MAG TPA: hypothetical protein VGH54_21615 [Mycobacterium sp.]|jgi:hypothetical protein|uniref:hypothetical protein n=1 Tax=Mycobacterium sp. TaxID=1785 RepID=UPI002F41D1B4
MAQSVSGTWDAMLASFKTLFAGQDSTLVTPGDPGEFQPDLLVCMMGVRGPITQPTAGTNRSRDKRIQVTVVVSAYRAGGEEAQQAANDAAWAGADTIEAYFRTSPNERLGGACYNAFVEVTDMTPSISWERVDGMDTPVAAGRICDIAMTVSVWIRI